MAGNVLSQTKTFQPAEETDISQIVCLVSIRQPNASATTNPQLRLQATVQPRSNQSADACTIQFSLQRQGVSGTGIISITTSIVSSTQTFDTGWIATSAITNSTGSDTWVGRLYYENQGETDSDQLSVSMSGQIYWTQPVTTNYTVTYNANGGSSTPSSQTQQVGKSVQLAAAISRSGYSFAGWNTNSNGTGTNYNAGSWQSFSSNITLYAKWSSSSGGGGSTSNTSIKIYCTNSNDKCYVSTSSIMGTSASGNGTRSVTLSCAASGVTMKPMRVSFLPDPAGNRYPNSMALLVEWWNPNGNDGAGSYYCNQEVIFAPATAAKGAKWTDHALSTRILNESTVWTDQPTQIDVTSSSTGSTSGGTVTKLTLNDWYIAGVGTSNGTANTSVGSYNNPANWYMRGDGSHGVAAPRYYRKLSWTKPSTGTPLYYVINMWKGYSTTDNRAAELAEVNIASGTATSLLNTSGYWNDGWGKYIKYTVHAVYSDGVNPTFTTAQAQAKNGVTYGMGSSSIETWGIWWRMYTPPTSYELKFYQQNKSTLLTDSAGSAYDYYVPQNAKIVAPSDIKSGSTDLSESYNITGWYKKEGTGSWGTTALTNLGSMGTTALSFAQVIAQKTYTITYTNTSMTTATVTINHGDSIVIDNADGTNETTKIIKANYTITAPTKTGYKFTGYSYDSNTHTFSATWISDKYVYIYNGSAWQKYKAYICTGGSTWKPATYFIYANDTKGWV